MNTAVPLSDILSAASLLLAVAGALFGLWYPEIVDVLGESTKSRTEDRNPQRRRVSGTILSRALPLSAVSLVPALVFLPDATNILLSSWQLCCVERAPGVVYDSVRTAFVCVVAIALGIAIYAIVLLARLITMRVRLGPWYKPPA